MSSTNKGNYLSNVISSATAQTQSQSFSTWADRCAVGSDSDPFNLLDPEDHSDLHQHGSSTRFFEPLDASWASAKLSKSFPLKTASKTEVLSDTCGQKWCIASNNSTNPHPGLYSKHFTQNNKKNKTKQNSKKTRRNKNQHKNNRNKSVNHFQPNQYSLNRPFDLNLLNLSDLGLFNLHLNHINLMLDLLGQHLKTLGQTVTKNYNKVNYTTKTHHHQNHPNLNVNVPTSLQGSLRDLIDRRTHGISQVRVNTTTANTGTGGNATNR